MTNPKKSLLVPAILCGGSGSRLWPASRESHPKPFIRLADGQSLLQKAFLRGARLDGASQLLAITNREFFFKTEDDLREVNKAKTPISYILEPCGRNTAAAIAAASLQMAQTHGKDTVLLVLAADHLITNQAAFQQAVTQATKLAQTGALVTFGIRPNAPETGYGYIEAQGSSVLRFIEKPSLEQAQAYLCSGRFLWNSGMFCFTVGTMLEQMKLHCPEILNATRACIAVSQKISTENSQRLELNSQTFSTVPADSIDYAVMEKSDQIAVVPCDIGWSDIGSWTALGKLTQADSNGNRTQGETLLHDTNNCIIQSTNRLVATAGVSDLIVVDTPDAVLVAEKNSVQDIKHLYAKLKIKNHETYKHHRTVHRPWGTYTILEEGPGFKVKRLEIKPGARLSLQMHYHRSEHWVVVSGVAKIINGERALYIHVNESAFIPAGRKHRVENTSSQCLIMIEVQSGAYLGEDDIVRFDDNYGGSTANKKRLTTAVL